MPSSHDTEALRREGALLARYLLGRQPPERVIDLYVAACEKLEAVPEDGLLPFAMHNPWALGPLDAASALLRPQSSLRRRLLVISAILEASASEAHRFMPRALPPSGLFFLLARYGAAWMLKLAAGLALWPLAVGGRA